jgi:hypothetical protein
MRTVEKKRKRKTEHMHDPEFWERHERTQRMLAERLAYHQAKINEERAANGLPPRDWSAS